MLRSLLKVLKSSSSLNHQCGWVGFLSLQNKFILPFNESNKDPSVQEKILKQRLNAKMQVSIKKQEEQNASEEDLTSWDLTPSFLERGFNYLLIPIGALSINVMVNEYNTAGYLNSLCLLTDWMACVTCGYAGIYFAMACLKYNNKVIKNPLFKDNYRYSFCFPTVLAANVSLLLMYNFDFNFFIPIGLGLILSFWKDYYMIEDFALPRFFINYKLKLILISNLVFLIVVFALLQSVSYNKKMFSLKEELENKIALNLETFQKEDEEIERKHEIIMKNLQDPKI